MDRSTRFDRALDDAYRACWLSGLLIVACLLAAFLTTACAPAALVPVVTCTPHMSDHAGVPCDTTWVAQ